mgnify:CR=1 FL=1
MRGVESQHSRAGDTVRGGIHVHMIERRALSSGGGQQPPNQAAEHTSGTGSCWEQEWYKKSPPWK